MALNHKQELAAHKLELALNSAGRAGLQGGVYDGTFCVWPLKDRDNIEPGLGFFEQVEEYGQLLSHSAIDLDGGAGV